MPSVILGPAAAEFEVCDEDRMQAWSDAVVVAMTAGGFLRADLSASDTLDMQDVVEREIRTIIRQVFDHPNIRVIRREPID